MLNKNQKSISERRGFIALTLVLVISSIILAFTFIRGIETGEFFDQVELKKIRIMNYKNAYKCIDQAIINLTHDYFYEVSTSTLIYYLHCSIDMVKRENDFFIIQTSGNYRNIIVKRKAIIRLYDNSVEIVSIE